MPSALQFSPRLRDIKPASAEMRAYWYCPETRRRMDAETQHARDVMNSDWDRRMVANNTRLPANWTPQEKLDAIAKIGRKIT